MTNLLGNVWSAVKGRASLLLAYALIIALVASVGWSVGTVWQNRATVKELRDKATGLEGQVARFKGDLGAAIQSNKDQDAAITELRRLRDIDSQALDGLHTELAKAGSRGDDLRARVRELERTNADAKALLDTAVPPELGCLLDRAPCTGAGGNNANGGSAIRAR